LQHDNNLTGKIQRERTLVYLFFKTIVKVLSCWYEPLVI
jgi:hypothetical protein